MHRGPRTPRKEVERAPQVAMGWAAGAVGKAQAPAAGGRAEGRSPKVGRGEHRWWRPGGGGWGTEDQHPLCSVRSGGAAAGWGASRECVRF